MTPEDVPIELATTLGQKLYEDHGQDCSEEDCDGHPGPKRCAKWAREILATVLPAHEAQIRAKVADEIEALGRHRASDPATISTLAVAAAVARGDR